MADEYQEYVRHYSDGWGTIKSAKTGVVKTFHACNFRDDTNVDVELYERGKPVESVKITTKLLSDTAKWFYPESRYVNTESFVVRCVAYPNRQYSKALTRANCYFSEATPLRYKGSLIEATKPSMEEILIGYGEEYPTYKDSLQSLYLGEAVGRAFSKRFMLALHPDVVHPLLICKNVLIGYDRGDMIVINREAEELTDTIISLTKKGVTYENR